MQVVQTLQVVGVAADAQVTALGQIDPYYVYAFDPATGSAILDRSARRGTIEIDRTRRVSADL